jgi:glycosyltransferase involved in cell wall biosynthesis
MKKIILTSNTSWFIWNFKKALIDTLLKKGYEVYVVAPKDEYSNRFPNFVPLRNLNRKGKNPANDLRLLWEYILIFRKLRPDIVLNFTVKPNIYSSLACIILGIKCISSITGLGYTFIEQSLLTKLVALLYKIVLARNYKVIFLNPDDLNLFLKMSIVNKDKAVIIKGEGVNAKYFSPEFCEESRGNSFVFLMVSRLLWEKGVGEFVEAGRILKKIYGDKVEFWLLGPVDRGNPSSVSEEDIKEWEEEGIIKYLGVSEDVRPFLCKADCVVLPSYREGMPRSLLEAMAMEKPIITTDSPGCKEVCRDGENGFLVKVKDVESLYNAMKKMLELGKEERLRMGKKGREMVINEFGEEKVTEVYMHLIESALAFI